MTECSFYIMCYRECEKIRASLMTLYERRDKIKYIECPALEKDYMEKLGAVEEVVIREEIECELLEEKKSMIQASINRREPVDEQKIDAAIENRRQKILQEELFSPLEDMPQLDDESMEKLQQTYRFIVRNFHPQTFTNLTSYQIDLYNKALNAYRRKDLDALSLISEMLLDTKPELTEQVDEKELAMITAFAKGLRQADAERGAIDDDIKKWEESTIAPSMKEEYDLCEIIFDFMEKTAEEASVIERVNYYSALYRDIINEIDEIKQSFPYNAKELLADDKKVEEYRANLSLRLHNAKKEKQRKLQTINNMLEAGKVAHG